ncbi:MAG TPA: nuclear transport factor 2 family protein [Meiothermus sp.]|jgi:putative hydrolase of HD superfamily|nr:nuclear transport factor 2 family protein [Meiothermus sp.]
MDDPQAVVQAQLEAFNTRDIEAFVACYAPDAQILRFPSGGLIAEGHQEIRQRWGHLFAEDPDLQARVASRMVSEGFVIDDERAFIRGRQDDGIVIYEVRDGLIRRCWFVVWDMDLEVGSS